MTVNEIKRIKALHIDKFRKEQQSFLIEGPKMLNEVLKSDFTVKAVYALASWIGSSSNNLPVVEISPKELSRISQLKTPNQVVAEVVMKKHNKELPSAREEVILALDGINNPGNLGTIIRTADWFGVQHIVCSENCTDLYNPKVLQATMGSFTRVNLYFTNLQLWLSKESSHASVFGAVMDGLSLYNTELQKKGILLIGNESQGISTTLKPFISHKITIPTYGGAESLNASIAAAVILAEMRRR